MDCHLTLCRRAPAYRCDSTVQMGDRSWRSPWHNVALGFTGDQVAGHFLLARGVKLVRPYTYRHALFRNSL